MSQSPNDAGTPRSTGGVPDPGGSGPVAPRPSASRAVLVYSAGRIVAFLVSLGFLRLLGFHTYALFLGALLLSALLSLALLRRQRTAVSESLAARPGRDALTRRRPGRRGVGTGGETGRAADTADTGDDAYDPYADDDEDDEVESGADPGDASDRPARPRP